MADLGDRPPSGPAPGPRIGEDEWVARSGERRLVQGRIATRVLAAYERVPKPLVFGLCVCLAALVPVLASQSVNDIYYVRGPEPAEHI